MGFGPSNFQFGSQNNGGPNQPFGSPQPMGQPQNYLPQHPQWGGQWNVGQGRPMNQQPQSYGAPRPEYSPLPPAMNAQPQPYAPPPAYPSGGPSPAAPFAALPLYNAQTAGFAPASPQADQTPPPPPMQQSPSMQPPQPMPGRFAFGGSTPHMQSPMLAAPLPKGLIASPVAGRTDSIEVTAKPGSFIFPADVVSGLGQGNTLAGERILDSLLKGGPKMSKPMMPRSKGFRRFADGGATQEVPIIVAGGEYAAAPEEVASVGGGDYDKGHKILSNMVVGVRKQVINQLENLPGPVK